MLCAACGKESKNQRVCPYCFTPYATDAAALKRPSQTGASVPPAANASGPSPAEAPTPITDAIEAVQAAAKRAWAFYRRQSQTVQLTSAGIVFMLFLWWATGGEPEAATDAATAVVEAPPMERETALAIIKQTRETAIVDVQQDEVFVSYPAATFPVLEEGQRLLAEQFTAADAAVEGRRRRLYFYNPNGKLFAQADAVRGVVMVR